jgi:ribosomal subunit interface protein
VEIVLCGRNVEVPQHFREHTSDKLSRVERYDYKIIRMDVELSHEPNPRRSKNCQRVEITGRGRGPVVRGEACASDFYCALDQAVARLEARLRRAHDRRRVHHGRRVPLSVARATGSVAVTVGDTAEIEAESMAGTATLVEEPEAPEVPLPVSRTPLDDGPPPVDDDLPDDPTAWDPPDADEEESAPGRVARRKEHHAVPMSVDDALSQMELVGHDFFLFADAATGRPSVVYRRRGYDYGVIALA